MEIANTSDRDGRIFHSRTTLNVVLPCVMSFLVIVIVIGNFMALVVFIKTPKLRDIAGVYMMNLVATDLTYGALVLPLTIISSAYGRWVFGRILCQFKGFLTSLLCSVSFGTLGLLSLEKYIAILKPLHYSQIMTTKAMAVSLCGLWMYMGTLSILPLFGFGKYDFIPAAFTCTTEWRYSAVYGLTYLFAGLLPSMATINITYFFIFRAARRQARRINTIEVRMCRTDTTEGVNSCVSVPTDSVENGQRQSHLPTRSFNKRQTKAAMTVLIVVGVFMLSWSPFAIANTWSVATNTPLPVYVELVVTWLACLNSALNPYIYAVRTKSFQNGLMRVARSCSCTVRGRELNCLSWRPDVEESHST
ncbi:beta-1 adrenergic receptor-like [Ptychodera flava]|uniref:beta-1 adrenergic receptor-like n=1 Tax=Ptychodera flava TaxID=63121 RepID=UPI00396A1F52